MVLWHCLLKSISLINSTGQRGYGEMAPWCIPGVCVFYTCTRTFTKYFCCVTIVCYTVRLILNMKYTWLALNFCCRFLGLTSDRMAGAVLFVLYIPVETDEGAESVVSQSHDSNSASENDTDDTTTNQNDSIHKSNSGVSIGDSHSGNVTPACSPALVRKGDNVSVSSELKTSHVVSAAGDTKDTPGDCVDESNVTCTDGMDDMKISTEGRCAINTFPEGVSPKKDGTGDASETMDDAEKGNEESEKGRDGSEQKEELGTEGSLSEDSIVYTTECITLEQVTLHRL